MACPRTIFIFTFHTRLQHRRYITLVTDNVLK